MGEPQDLADKFVSQIEKVGMRVGNVGEKIGNQLVGGFDLVALFVIGGTDACPWNFCSTLPSPRSPACW